MIMDCRENPQPGGREKYVSMHPLEMFAFFRRYRPSPLRTIIYTFIFSCMIAAFFIFMAVIFRPFPSLVAFGGIALSPPFFFKSPGFFLALVLSVGKPLLRRLNMLPFSGIIVFFTA